MTGTALPQEWLRPDWPAPANVRACCTTREGGFSHGGYAGLNLGDHVGDDPQAVAKNRQWLKDALPSRPVFLQQIHGQQVLQLGPKTVDGLIADACVTDQSGLACTIMVADCLPILLTDLQGRVVAAAHAGWRGLAGVDGGGVVEATVARMTALSGLVPSIYAGQLMAWLGPCIGPTAFQVGDEVRQTFVSHDDNAHRCFTADGPGKWRADLAALARQRLAAAGVKSVSGNDGSASWCTVGQPSKFFSHRRDRISGRFAACIWLNET